KLNGKIDEYVRVVHNYYKQKYEYRVFKFNPALSTVIIIFNSNNGPIEITGDIITIDMLMNPNNITMNFDNLKYLNKLLVNNLLLSDGNSYKINYDIPYVSKINLL